ncbi:helix-turn-helix domain-containing protein [Mannheimia haemolytica]|uniref:helix-turn-helix domain-containing protein n=1 Tax=Mannheimia haemolytica TaxID=75985 RepID=UPI00201C5378|nr:helix-turn-helix transcriptional regulator [Mannheimia haemolytica]UQX70245.1 helix-turn-helix transcriptional regulator [Mannheimia haemolytica]
MKVKFKNISLMGSRIRDERERAGRTRNELADTLGVSLSTLQLWESNEREPQASMVITLAEELGVDAGYLLTGVKPQKSLNIIREPQHTYNEKPQIGDGEVVVIKAKLQEAIETLEEVLEITHKEMKPAGKAQMIWAFYELLTQEKSEKEKMVGLLKLVA